MARIDKYDPVDGGFRAPLNADFSTPLSAVRAVTLNATGKVVIGGAIADVVGVLVLTKEKKAGDIVDVMTDGEIVEAALAAGTQYYAQADGTISTVQPLAGANTTRVGHTVEADRLVVRVQRVQVA